MKRRVGITAALLCSIGVVSYAVVGGPSMRTSNNVSHVSGEDMVLLLKEALPRGKVSNEGGAGARGNKGGPSAYLVFDDGQGPSFISVHLGRTLSGFGTDCPNRSDNPYSICIRKERSDGGVLVIDQGYVDPLNPSGTKLWSAALTTRDGGKVIVSELNSSSPTGDSASRLDPPLNSTMLERIATSGAWASILASLPAPSAAPAPPSVPVLTKRTILETLEHEVPAGMRITKESGPEKGYVEVSLDDGRGANLVTVSVQRWKIKDPRIVQLFQGAERKANGTLVVNRKVPVSEDGNVERWEADTLRPNGIRVLITQSNAYAYGLPASRKTLPLRMSQLTSIALRKAWSTAIRGSEF